MGIITKGMGVILRNRASAKAFKSAKGIKSAKKLKYPVIKSVPIAKNLTSRRKEQQRLFKSVDDQYKKVGVKPGPQTKASKIKKDAAKRVSAIHDKYGKGISDRKKYNRKLKQKTFGGASAAIAGTVGAHLAAKKKFPKYKKFMERDITVKDGKLKLVPKKKKK